MTVFVEEMNILAEETTVFVEEMTVFAQETAWRGREMKTQAVDFVGFSCWGETFW